MADDDRKLELGLEELLGDKRPPDLTGRILMAARGRSRTERRGADPSRRRFGRGWPTAAALLVGCVIGAVLWPDARPTVTIAVTTGSLSWAGTSIDAGGRRQCAIEVGDHLSGSPARTTRFELGTVAELTLEPGTDLEVQTMQWRDFGGGLALGAVTIGVISGSMSRSGETVAAGETTTLVDVAEIERRARWERDRASQGAPPMASSPQAPAGEPAPPVMTPGRVAAALRALDLPALTGDLRTWHELARALAEPRQGGDHRRSAERLEALIERTRYRSARLIELGVPGSGSFGGVSHPAVIGEATTEAVGPIDPEVEAIVRETIERFSERIAEIEARYRDRELSDLDRLMAEAALKREFDARLLELLSPEQRRRAPRGEPGRLRLDLGAEGFAWLGHAEPVRARDRTELSAKVAERLATSLGIDAVQRPMLDAVVDRWAASADFDAADELGRAGYPQLERVRRAAAHQVEMYRDLLDTIELSERQRARLLDDPRVFVAH